jgi:integrase/recombinase XerD
VKINGNGQGKILSSNELRSLFTDGFSSDCDRAIFGICLYTGCRISESLSLRTTDIRGGVITFRRRNTKGKATRAIAVQPPLQLLLDVWQPPGIMLFPGLHGVRDTMSRRTADKHLREACQRIGIEGVSTHSFRRTALTQMHNAGIPLRHIQKISGHNDLGTLQRYLEVSPEQAQKAVSVIGY